MVLVTGSEEDVTVDRQIWKESKREEKRCFKVGCWASESPKASSEVY